MSNQNFQKKKNSFVSFIRDAILKEITKLEDILKAYLNTIEKSKALEETTIQHKKQSEILHVALGDKNHELHTLGTRYDAA